MTVRYVVYDVLAGTATIKPILGDAKDGNDGDEVIVADTLGPDYGVLVLAPGTMATSQTHAVDVSGTPALHTRVAPTLSPAPVLTFASKSALTTVIDGFPVVPTSLGYDGRGAGDIFAGTVFVGDDFLMQSADARTVIVSFGYPFPWINTTLTIVVT